MGKSLQLHMQLTAERAEALAYMCQVYSRTKTEIINGMIDHWAEVLKDQEARGVRVMPVGDFKAVMMTDRAGLLDDLAEDKGDISAEMSLG